MIFTNVFFCCKSQQCHPPAGVLFRLCQETLFAKTDKGGFTSLITFTVLSFRTRSYPIGRGPFAPVDRKKSILKDAAAGGHHRFPNGVYRWWTTLDGRNPANQLGLAVYLIIHKVLYIQTVVFSLDFWTINSMTDGWHQTICRRHATRWKNSQTEENWLT